MDERFVVRIGKLHYLSDKFGMLLKRRGRGYLKPFKDKDGYLKYALTQHGKTLNLYVHRVVWIIKKGGIPEGYTVDHIDGNKLNNLPNNLQLLIPEENAIKGNARYWLVTDPEDRTYYVYNLESFSKIHNLHPGHLRATSRNKVKHKGWYCHEFL